MFKKFQTAFLIGAFAGVVCGLTEASILLVKIQWRIFELKTIIFASAVYGLIGGVMALIWAFFARRIEFPTFTKRSFIFGFSAMAFLFGGFYINTACFPEITSRPSLLFTAAWIVGWSIFWFFLLRIPPAVQKQAPPKVPVLKIFGLLFLFTGAAAGLLFFASPAWTQTEPSAVSRPNVLLIVLDTLRADHLSGYGYSRKTSPHLDRLMKESVVFEQASSAAPWTLPSHASLFSGLYPSQHQTQWSHQLADDKLTMLSEMLKDQGYQTAGFSNNPWVSEDTNFDQGFDYFEGAWLGGRLIHRLAVFVRNKTHEPLRQSLRDLAIGGFNAEVDLRQLVSQLLSGHAQCFGHLYEAHSVG